MKHIPSPALAPESSPRPSDPASDTYASRLEIGFDFEREDWKHAEAVYTDETLRILGHPVMEDWETPYMARLAQVATSVGGRVLEVGFGMGISAAMIQRHPIDEHVVIEANAQVFERLRAFAAEAARPVRPLFGFWQDVIGEIADDSIDGILFDTYPLKAAEVHTNHMPFLRHAHRILRSGGVLTYYSDEHRDFSPTHRAALAEAGFDDIRIESCPVSPPPDCEYWDRNALLVPIVRKA